TSFLLFGQRTYRVGPSNVASNVAHGAAAMAGKAVRMATGPSGKGGPGGRGGYAGPGAAQASRILDGGGGWGGGNVVASTGGRGQPPAGTPVTTAASNFDMHKGNSEALKNAMAAVTGDNSAAPPDYAGSEMVSGHIKFGGKGAQLGGALDGISPEMKRTGVVTQVRDSASGTAGSVNLREGADGKVSISTPEGGTAADEAMVARVNS